MKSVTLCPNFNILSDIYYFNHYVSWYIDAIREKSRKVGYVWFWNVYIAVVCGSMKVENEGWFMKW